MLFSIILILLCSQCFTFTFGEDIQDLISNVSPTEYPYVAAVSVVRQIPRIYFTGVVVNPKWAMLAAHCVWHLHNQLKPKKFYIKAGTVKPTSTDKEHVQKRFVDRVVFHYRYSPNASEYDLALLRVTNPFNLGMEYVDTIRLSDRPFPNITRSCLVLGFDLLLTRTGEHLGELRSAVMETGDYNYCNHISNKEMDDQFLCVRYRDPDADTPDKCYMDYGKVLVCSGNLAGFSVTGCNVNSSINEVENCEETRGYSVFVFVGTAYPWAKEYIKDLEDPVPLPVGTRGIDYASMRATKPSDITLPRRSNALHLPCPSTSVLLLISNCLALVS